MKEEHKCDKCNSEVDELFADEIYVQTYAVYWLCRVCISETEKKTTKENL